MPIRVRTLLYPLLALLACGCGIDEYDEKMKAEQSRVEKLDVEFKELDAPLKMPTLNEEAHNEVDVFVRPPRGIPSSPHRDKNENYYRNGPFFWWLNPDQNKPVNAVLLAIIEKSDQQLDIKQLVTDLGGSSEEVKPTEVNLKYKPGKASKVVFVNNNGKFFLFVDANKKAAVCYRVSTKQEDQSLVVKQVNASIDTLAVGSEVSKLLGDYNKRAKGAKK